ncbi:hypothetical protein GJ744_010205 [Endocarpon pusillum]|uniref:Uncharacterized protein n=1 Tax=Endocarpon pusillum TaxID=364733 RepID=A0A8H7AIJ9_9EURO|nr:hypothetical protein GJ744_010205 [Endocarpon pusillum]
MAAPGIGVGDIVNACRFIYDVCVRYKDAPKEFDEVADKAKTTAVTLTRLDDEARMGGSLVERAGPEAYDQLQQNLKSLRSDSEKLGRLVAKYERIHDEGPGRRLLWALKESGDLTDMRRRIGYHEQTLQLWYMTLVYGSLRRLEGGQEDIIKAIKSMRHDQLDEIMKALDHGDRRPLEEELKRKGVSQQNIEANLVTAVDYIEADPVDKVRIESRARSMSTTMRPSSYESGPYSNLPPREFPSYPKDDNPFDHKLSHLDSTKPLSGMRRSRSTRKPTTHYDEDWLKDDRPNDLLSVRVKSRPGKEYRSKSHKEPIIVAPHESSSRRRLRCGSEGPQAPLGSSLLVVPGNGPVYRSDSEHRRTRSSSRARNKGDSDASPVIIVNSRRYRSESCEEGEKRDSSRHSFHRVRRSSSRGSDREEGVDKIVLVRKMDRIDSVPVDE